jgi:beta-lactamase superfamily II metal-dependent hydrolase
VVRLGVDGSVPNGSSIAFVFEYGGRRVLLSGDAHAGVLRDSIRRLLDERGDALLHLDAFKLSHHGSRNNISGALLDLIACDTFLVSTNGDKFNHPDAEAIELIASRAGGSRPQVVFNYRNELTAFWEHDERIEAVYGDDGFVQVEL